MPRGRRLPEPTVRVLDWSTADSLDLEATAAHLGTGGRARLETASPGDARRFLIGRALLTRTLVDAFDVDATSVRISARCPQCGLEHGRPSAVVGDRRIHTSISHTTDATAVAVSTTMPVGIDLERLDPARFTGVEGVALSPAEFQRWSSLPRPARLRSVAATWTAKEAVLKAVGTGLTIDPSTIDLPEQHDTEYPVRLLGHGVLVSDAASEGDLVVAVAHLVD
ncbi:4'-phosphopantetheinyl transferase superfamily protein [Plantibacter flavus]|uniref:4'-phosphopantetheinyl transferase family protein n=1 Tax=Plantibacter flavus TaxID=150123 RepID=UPI003F16B492